MFHEFGIYSGAILPVALIWVWIRRGALPERRALIAAVTVFAAVGLVLALGRYGGVAALLTHVPVLQSLRAPVRYIVLMQFALAILAAVTIDDLLAIADGTERRRRPARWPPLWIPAALGVATTIALNMRLLPYGRHTSRAQPAAPAGVAIVAAVTLLVYLAGRRVRWAVAALVVVTAADLGAVGHPVHLPRTAADDRGTDAARSARARRSGGFVRGRAGPRTVQRGSPRAARIPAHDRVRRALPRDAPSARQRHRPAVVGDAMVFHGRTASRQPADGGVDAGAAARRAGARRQQEARGSPSIVPGYLVADVDAPGRQHARVHRTVPRWLVGDRSTACPLPMIRVEDDFLGCVVDAGVHRVTLRFMPRSFVYGSIVSAIGAALLAGVLIAQLG